MTSNPEKTNQLQIQVRFRNERGEAGDVIWRRECVRHFINLRGYLIGAIEAD
jgi:hypothetical protein